MAYRAIYILEWLFLSIFLAALVTFSSPPPTDEVEHVRAFTRQVEFDYGNWMADALRIKLQQGAAGLPNYVERAARKEAVLELLRVTQRILEGEAVLSQIYADAAIEDKESATATVRADLDELYKRQQSVAPLAEAVFQEQITDALAAPGPDRAGTADPVSALSFQPGPERIDRLPAGAHRADRQPVVADRADDRSRA